MLEMLQSFFSHILYFGHLAEAFVKSDQQGEKQSSHYATETCLNQLLPSGAKLLSTSATD